MAPTESEIVAAFAAAKNISTVRERNRKQMASSFDLADLPALAAKRQALAQIAEDCFDVPPAAVERFERGRAERDAQLTLLSNRERQIAIDQSKANYERVLSTVAAYGQAIEKLTAYAGGDTRPRIFLNTPYLIDADSDVAIESSHIEPSKSRAKFRVESAMTNETHELSFRFLWQNPSAGYVVVNVNAYLVLHGRAEVKSSGGFFAGNRFSRVVVGASLRLAEWWNQPPTTPAWHPDSSRVALDLPCYSGTTFDDDAFAAADIYRGYDMPYSMLLLPPGESVGIDVTPTIWSRNGQGRVKVDFASGGYEVACPGVLVTILT